VKVHTRSQKLAQQAYGCVEARNKAEAFAEYETVARKFPALIHTCGLAQAVAFAHAKRKKDRPGGGPECAYIADLAAVLKAGGHAEIADAAALEAHTRGDTVTTYLRLSRDAIEAAIWLKRYAEALGEDVPTKQEAKT
jgi:CRISPR-associated protein Cmr5